MSDHFEYDVFLSHNKADKQRVRQLAERLKAAGMKVWFDDWVVKSGDIILQKVNEGIGAIESTAAVSLAGGAQFRMGDTRK